MTDMQLRALKPTGKLYKVADQLGLYVAVTKTGVVSFRFDHELLGRRETLVVGRYDASLGARQARDLDHREFGMSLSLAEARLLVSRARRSLEQGESPSRAKVKKRVEASEALTFGSWAKRYFAEAELAESTRSMRKSVYDRNLAAHFGRLKLHHAKSSTLLSLLRQGRSCRLTASRDKRANLRRNTWQFAGHLKSCPPTLRACHAHPRTDRRAS